MLDLNHIMPLIVLTRDRDGGSIELGPDGLPRINYVLSKHDTLSMEDGMERSLKILVAAGAKTVYTTQRGVEACDVNPELGTEDPKFKTFLAEVKKTSVKPGSAIIGAAHQMGTW